MATYRLYADMPSSQIPGPEGSWERLHPRKSLAHQGRPGATVWLCLQPAHPSQPEERERLGGITSRAVAPWSPSTPASGPLSKCKTQQRRQNPHMLCSRMTGTVLRGQWQCSPKRRRDSPAQSRPHCSTDPGAVMAQPEWGGSAPARATLCSVGTEIVQGPSSPTSTPV